jgi:glutamyl-tRNA reductase
MNRLALIGVSHRRGGSRVLSEYHEAYRRRGVAERLRSVGIYAFVEFATCNRIDVLVSNPSLLPLGTLRAALNVAGAPRKPYAFVGEGALEQLARVAASVDSLNPGEDQIMRQVRDAAQAARVRGEVDSSLSFAIDAALRIARRVRREVALAPRDTSLFSLVRPQIEALIASRGGRLRALVLGAGEMARLSAKLLRGLSGVELVIANRDLARAHQLAAEVGGESRSLASLADGPPAVELVVAAIPGSKLLPPQWLASVAGLALVVDLGVPPAIDARVAHSLQVPLIDSYALERLGEQRRQVLDERLREAERVIQLGVADEMIEWAQRSLSPAIQHLHALYQAELRDLLPDAEARSVALRLANIPVRGLRALARDHGVDAVRTFTAESGLPAPNGVDS